MGRGFESLMRHHFPKYIRDLATAFGPNLTLVHRVENGSSEPLLTNAAPNTFLREGRILLKNSS